MAWAAQRPVPRVHPELPATASRREANNSPALAVDPTEQRFVALADRIDSPDFSCALQVSGDGGRGWLPANPVPKDRLPDGAEKCYSPEVAFDGKGRLYYLFSGLQGLGNVPVGVFLTTSDDRGRTFSSPRKVLGANNFQVRMAIDADAGQRGRLHLVWLAASAEPGIGALPPPPNPIMAAYSDDGGATFSQPLQVSDPGRQRVVAPALALAPGGRVHVLYYDLGTDAVDYQGLEGPTWEGTWSLVLASSRDGGRRFERGVVIDDQVVPPGRVMLILTMAPPALIADRSGILFAAWRDAREGDPDVWLRDSTDGGRSWQPARRVNDDAAGADQDLPRLAVAPGGRLDAIFYDRRDDPEGIRLHVYYAYSDDGGRTFAPNLRITTKPSDSRVGQRYSLVASAAGLVEFGSRLALVSRDDRVTAAWTDTRFSIYPAQQDVMTTVIEWPRPPAESGQSAILVTAVAGATGAAAVVTAFVLRRRARRSRPAR